MEARNLLEFEKEKRFFFLSLPLFFSFVVINRSAPATLSRPLPPARTSYSPSLGAKKGSQYPNGLKGRGRKKGEEGAKGRGPRRIEC